VDDVIQEIVDSNFDLYKRITDDRVFGESIKNLLFDIYLRSHRQAAELLKQHESKTLEFKSTVRWNLKENRKDPGSHKCSYQDDCRVSQYGGRRRSHWGFG
jgi:hypothetical protein